MDLQIFTYVETTELEVTPLGLTDMIATLADGAHRTVKG